MRLIGSRRDEPMEIEAKEVEIFAKRKAVISELRMDSRLRIEKSFVDGDIQLLNAADE